MMIRNEGERDEARGKREGERREERRDRDETYRMP